MFHKPIIALLCALLTLISANCFANEFRECSISNIEGHKVYLRPGTIQVANNGIFINVRGQLKAIDHLGMDSQGVYFEIERMAGLGDSCPACFYPLVYGFCVNPDCHGKR